MYTMFYHRPAAARKLVDDGIISLDGQYLIKLKQLIFKMLQTHNLTKLTNYFTLQI